MPDIDVPLSRLRFGQTTRRDAWWGPQAITFVVFTGFIVYSTWAAFQGKNYYYGNYLSPMYSPEIWGVSHHAFIHAARPSWLPSFLPYTAALAILWAPAGFRFTCYYYRGAYYKSHWADPPACAVGEPRKTYWGERKLPLIIHNLHRYFAYLAVVFLFFLAHDAWKSMWFLNAKTEKFDQFGVGIGTLIFVANVCLLASYTFGCHSLRHLIGGNRDKFSDAPVRHACWQGSSWFNRRHMMFAWLSLFCVMGADIYVRLLASGCLSHDPRII